MQITREIGMHALLTMNVTVRALNTKCIYPHTSIVFKLQQTSGGTDGSRVMHTVRVHNHKGIFQMHTLNTLMCFRRQYARMVHKWSAIFGTTIPGVHCQINTPHNTQTTIDIRIHAWFASDAHS